MQSVKWKWLVASLPDFKEICFRAMEFGNFGAREITPNL
jgi:hypothetical protein